MVKLNKKIIYIFMIIIILFSNLQNIVLAKEIGDSAKLKSIGHCNRNVEFKFSSGWSTIKCDYIGYTDGGKNYPAYCVLHGKDGVEDAGSYSVDLTKILDDVRLYRVIINGFPYKTPSQLGVEDEYDAYMATKQAINCVMLDRDVRSLYRGKDSSGNKVVDAIEKLVNIGRNGTQTFQTANLKINKSGSLVEEEYYYSQTYQVESAVQISSYDIISTANMPNGSYIADINGNKKTSFSGTEKFKLMIPKNSMTKDLNVIINIMGKCKTYPVFFGKTTVSNTQNYAVTSDPYGDYTARTTLNMNLNTGSIKVNKIDGETLESISGVTFELCQEDGTVIAKSTTNENGVATFYNLYQKKYILKEISTNENYILTDEKFEVNVEYNKTTTVNISNIHKKGNLKIIKVDKDDNTLPVSDVEFEVIDQDGYKYTAISDENGIAYITDIRIGIATIREVKTNKIYKLSEEIYEADIKCNETTEMTITNEKLKGQIEVYKVDSEDKEIKLEGVEFQVINSNDEVVETIVTDSNGYAITSRIPIGEYRLKEIKTDEIHILNENIIKVDVSTDIISRLDITNERIKGQIKVIKTSEDDNFINGKEAGSPIENVKFDVYDLNNNLVDEMSTSADGTAITRLLDKGCYFIKEVESGEWYLLNKNTFTAEIKEHQEIVNVEIKNESEKPDVDIEKTGIIQTTANQEIKYDFYIKNTGNVPLDKFTWIDSLPTEYVRITKLITGTYNQDLDYSIYYKTNKNDYRLLKDNLNTQTNNYIDFSNLELEADEYVTDFKADFGTVDVGFESVINPYIFVRVNSNVQNDDIFTNKIRIEGYNKTYMVWDEDNHTTKVYEKEIEVKKLPRTGM